MESSVGAKTVPEGTDGAVDKVPGESLESINDVNTTSTDDTGASQFADGSNEPRSYVNGESYALIDLPQVDLISRATKSRGRGRTLFLERRSREGERERRKSRKVDLFHLQGSQSEPHFLARKNMIDISQISRVPRDPLEGRKGRMRRRPKRF